MQHKQNGITLIETLVALAIMGLVTGAILILIGQNTRFAAAAQDRTYASIVADNLMVEALAGSRRIETGESLDSVSFAGRDWRYRKTIAETDAPDVYRIDIAILNKEETQALAHIMTLRKDES